MQDELCCADISRWVSFAPKCLGCVLPFGSEVLAFALRGSFAEAMSKCVCASLLGEIFSGVMLTNLIDNIDQ